jgi:hypothetical protein
LLNASPLVFALTTLVIIVMALLVWSLTRLPELIALSAIVIWVGCNAFKDVRDWLTR